MSSVPDQPDSSEIEYVVRIYEERDGELSDLVHEHNLSEFCNTLPSVGDMIVNPMVSGGLDRSDFNNREVFEVVSRYFLPSMLVNAYYAILVVKIRVAKEIEQDIVSNI